MEKAQKEYYLNEKIKAIHQELGRKDDRTDEVEELQEEDRDARACRRRSAEKADQELRRLEAMPPVSAEATVSRNYIDWLVGVPWKKASRESKDLTRAEKILNEDHFGLEKVKERILEFLAVRQLVQKTKGSIICFVGPPGRRQDLARASRSRASLNRKFVRLSLGGVRDEAEIRGHRRTYIGAFPGQIIQMMKKAGTVNPGVPARRGRQDVDRTSGATRRRRCSRCSTRSRTTPSWTTTSTSSTTSRRSCSSPRRTSLHPIPPALQGPDGGDPALRLHAEREGRDRAAVPRAEAARGERA